MHITQEACAEHAHIFQMTKVGLDGVWNIT
jgi:hypothetical protein